MAQAAARHAAYGRSSHMPVVRDFRVSHTKRRPARKTGRRITFLLLLYVASVLAAWAVGRHGQALLPLASAALEQAQAQVLRVGAWFLDDPATPQAPAAQAMEEQLVPGAPPHTGPAELDGGNVLDVPLFYQDPELKNGCEATALAMLLAYWGYNADKTALAYDHIPREDFTTASGARYGPHPGDAYAGDPATTRGFYCFPGPAAAGADSFLAQQGSALRASDISGAPEEDLAQYVRDGVPVMVWVTLDYGTTPTYLDFTWQLPDGTIYTPFGNLHCVVLAGVDDESYLVCDPIEGVISVGRQALLGSYQALGGHAIVVQ